MKETICIILIILSTSCSNKVTKNDIVKTFENKKDSVLFNLAKECEFEYKLFDNDTIHIQKSFPLYKKVYSKCLDLTFEFRQSYDCHDILEFIICYNDSAIYGIPLRDNFYYWQYRSDTSKYYRKLSFEKELNNAILFFSKNNTLEGKQISPLYSECFVRAIMENLSKFNCREIIPALDDFAHIKKRIKNDIKKRYSVDLECKKNALSNIKKLENYEIESRCGLKRLIMYDFMYNDCIYCFIFEDFAKSGKYVTVNVVNKECYFELIF